MSWRTVFSSQFFLRLGAAALGVFSLFFGRTAADGSCFGDRVLLGLGLPAWSRGAYGTHSPAVIGLAGLFLAFVLFALSTREKGKALHICLTGLLAVILAGALVG